MDSVQINKILGLVERLLTEEASPDDKQSLGILQQILARKVPDTFDRERYRTPLERELADLLGSDFQFLGRGGER